MRQTRPTRGLPTSRAYWELKAEQMMNRVFDPETPLDLEAVSADSATTQTAPTPRHLALPAAPGAGVVSTAAGGTAAKQGAARPSSPLTVLLLAALGGVGLVAALSAVLLVQQWAGLQRTLSQERNLLLVERLRTLGPATVAPTLSSPATPPAPVLDPVQPGTQPQLAAAADLPPPPPEEPWMDQLAALPPTQSPPLLRVPVGPRLLANAPATASSRPQRSSGPAGRAPSQPTSVPLPQLVGLVGAPGRAGSAIFQVGDTSANVNVGEQIGSSGWRLSAADGESALIERGSEVRRIAIVTGG